MERDDDDHGKRAGRKQRQCDGQGRRLPPALSLGLLRTRRPAISSAIAIGMQRAAGPRAVIRARVANRVCCPIRASIPLKAPGFDGPLFFQGAWR